MNQKKLEELRQHYDNTDTSEGIKDTELDDEIVQSPMVGITVRLPADVLERVRRLAADQGVKTTALIRRWIEDAIQLRAESSQGSQHQPLFGAQIGNVDMTQQLTMAWPHKGVDIVGRHQSTRETLNLAGFGLVALERIPEI